jgi:hypothetical protein
MDFPPISVVIDGRSMDILGGNKKFRKDLRARKLEQDLDKQGYEPTPERQSNSKVNPIDNANRIRAGLKDGTTLAELEKEKSGSDKKIDKFAFVHIEKMKKKKKETGPGSSNPKRVQRNLGGRMGYKDGSKCKLATKGKGRAYGKNS